MLTSTIIAIETDSHKWIELLNVVCSKHENSLSTM